MRGKCGKHGRHSERGVVFVIVLICLLLLFTLAVLMILNSGIESFLNGNYRASARVFYAAHGGLEEARGRLWPRNPNAFGSFITAPGTIMPVTEVRYIINALPGETVDPTDMSSGNPFADNQYQQEFGAPPPTSAPRVPSVSPVAGLDGPLYKWVRINPVTEQALKIDVNGDSSLDSTTPIFYDGSKLNLTSSGRQAFEITSLAVLADRSRKTLQYVVAPYPLNLYFPSALTLVGDLLAFNPSNAAGFWLDGRDLASGGSCPNPGPKYAIGGTKNSVEETIEDRIETLPPSLQAQYVGYSASPSVGDVRFTIPPSTQTVNAIEGPGGLIETITQNADYVVQGPATSLPDYGSASSPVVVVVQGQPGTPGHLTLTGSVSGYGLLLVNGKLKISGDFSWKGIILLLGQGDIVVTSSGSGRIDGAILAATTRDTSNNLLASFGTTLFDMNAGGNLGIYYNSCWISTVQNIMRPKVLSFRELPE